MTTLRGRAELLVPLLLAVIGVAAVIGGLGYGMTDARGRIGTGWLPVVAGATVAVLAVAELIGTRRRQLATARGEHHRSMVETIADVPEGELEGHGDGADDDVDVLGRTSAQRTRMLGVVVVLVIAAVALVPLLGLLVSFGLLLFAITAFVERMGLLPSALVTVITIAVLWAVFARFLSVPLPQGLLGVI